MAEKRVEQARICPRDPWCGGYDRVLRESPHCNSWMKGART